MKIRLSQIAHARSGDKGDAANCGVIAFKPEWYPILRDHLTAERVQEYFAGMCREFPSPKHSGRGRHGVPQT
jgi:hypothetical protein